MNDIRLYEYDSNWPNIFSNQAEEIRSCLGQNCLEIHHIGSTSIPGMLSKQDIDILCIVEDLEASRILDDIGYQFKGEYNIPLKYSYSKNTEDFKVNLHIVKPSHGFISLNLKFRDYLRQEKDIALQYASLKRKILEDPISSERTQMGISKYNLDKNLFIKDILNKAGFDDFIVNFVLHHKEWEEYHRIRKGEIFNEDNIIYDPNHPTITAENHYHFVLYKGAEIVSVAHIEFWDEKTAILRPFATDRKHQGKGYGSYFLRFLERWLKSQGKLIVKLHASNDAVEFYKNRGYKEMEFDEESLFKNCTDLGKEL